MNNKMTEKEYIAVFNDTLEAVETLDNPTIAEVIDTALTVLDGFKPFNSADLPNLINVIECSLSTHFAPSYWQLVVDVDTEAKKITGENN